MEVVICCLREAWKVLQADSDLSAIDVKMKFVSSPGRYAGLGRSASKGVSHTFTISGGA